MRKSIDKHVATKKTLRRMLTTSFFSDFRSWSSLRTNQRLSEHARLQLRERICPFSRVIEIYVIFIAQTNFLKNTLPSTWFKESSRDRTSPCRPRQLASAVPSIPAYFSPISKADVRVDASSLPGEPSNSTEPNNLYENVPWLTRERHQLHPHHLPIEMH